MSYFVVILEILLGMLYVNAGEWFMHKYILHGLGRNPRSFWAYHLTDHHAVCQKTAMLDPGYEQLSLTTWNTQTKEFVVMFLIVIFHLPLLYFIPWFTCAVYASLMLYYYKHRKAHLDQAWAIKHLRWHYEHHLGANDGVNWCVTWPWFDYLMGTRIKYERNQK